MASTEGVTRGGQSGPDGWIKRQNAGLWFGLAFLAFSVLFFRMSFDLAYMSKLGAGPGMYPRWLCGVSIVVAIAYIWQSCTTQVFRVGDRFPGRRELTNVATIFVSCVVFLLLLNHVGFPRRRLGADVHRVLAQLRAVEGDRAVDHHHGDHLGRVQDLLLGPPALTAVARPRRK